MTVSQVLLCALLGVIGINGKPPSRIVGGSLADNNEFPYLVGLTIFGQHVCGGAIIDSTHILTAAHCVDYRNIDLVENMVIVGGTTDIRQGNRHRVKSIKKHAMFSTFNYWKNDIAIITLRNAIEFNEREKAVKLPTEDTLKNVSATASGWGDLSYPKGVVPTELWKLDMNVIPKFKCFLPASAVHDSQLCAFTKKGYGLCAGDSGGPLVSDGVIIGIASYVYRCAKGYPDVFTRVYEYLDWIKKATN